MKKPTTRRIVREANEMEQAEIVLAAKAVTDALQDMAEKVAKIEADSILPLLDSIRTHFGPQYADKLSADAQGALNQLLDAIKNAKDQIGTNIDNMQGIVTGEGPGNDMANNVGVPDVETPATDDGAATDMDDDAPGADATPASDDVGVSDDEVNDVFASAPVGRDTKESLQQRAINMLREAKDPDAILIAETARLSKKLGTMNAVNEVAKRFSVDADDIVAIIKARVQK